MVVASSSSGINTILDQPPDVAMVGAVGAIFYVNTRTGTVAVTLYD